MEQWKWNYTLQRLCQVKTARRQLARSLGQQHLLQALGWDLRQAQTAIKNKKGMMETVVYSIKTTYNIYLD